VKTIILQNILFSSYAKPTKLVGYIEDEVILLFITEQPAIFSYRRNKKYRYFVLYQN